MIKAILTDIEGTTTSVAFVYDTLFPYFLAHLDDLLALQDDPAAQEVVQHCFGQIRKNLPAGSDDTAVIEQLRQWVREDRKETPLKTLQGVLWQKGYEKGEITGHIYDDVPLALKRWHEQGLTLAIYSSGSVAAQKLLFGFSDFGDLTRYISFYFDTHIGHKREADSYQRISEHMQIPAAEILFLSDIELELDAARAAGMQTLQLVRDGTPASGQHPSASDFSRVMAKH